ncbi:MAG: hypothetical protein K0S44_1591 [Bacteroidetes bacterium]|jgi:hypothetical protein|nr:hypothetical protein [Bacteroidota bacterium]
MTGPYLQMDAPMNNCCKDFSKQMEILPIDKEIKENTLSIFPNPSENNLVWVKFRLKTTKAANLHLMDMLGREVLHMQVSASERITDRYVQLDLSGNNLTKGIYLVVISNENESISQKLIIQ